MNSIFEAQNISCSPTPGHPLFSNASLTVNEKDIIVIQGKSGSGKSTFLKCLAHLKFYEGRVLLEGRTPKSLRVPNYRTRVFYVPQRPSNLPGTPSEFIDTVCGFSARSKKGINAQDTKINVIKIADDWGIDRELWDRRWTELSGGEGQRIALAAAVGMDTAEILLLDEPTSALDNDNTVKVEKFLAEKVKCSSTLRAILWITHSAEQGHRVGNRFVTITPTGCQEELVMV